MDGLKTTQKTARLAKRRLSNDERAANIKQFAGQVQYKIHPAANLFPMMDEDSFQQLKADIEANGQNEALIFWHGKLIDGRNRLRACQELGIEPTECELEDDVDPYKYVISANLHRRHLEIGQRAAIAAELANLKHGGDRKSNQIKGSIDLSIKQAAEALGVSEPSVKRAKAVIAKSSDDVVASLKEGSITLNQAVKSTLKPEKKPQHKGEHTQSEVFAMSKADVAITQLKGIPTSNVHRDAALTKACSWIFKNSANRLSALRLLIDKLEPCEVEVLKSWIETEGEVLR